jgi:hypothetical protein
MVAMHLDLSTQNSEEGRELKFKVSLGYMVRFLSQWKRKN